jgi:hypothetical protein
MCSVSTTKKKVTNKDGQKLARDSKLLGCKAHWFGVFYEIFPQRKREPISLAVRWAAIVLSSLFMMYCTVVSFNGKASRFCPMLYLEC